MVTANSLYRNDGGGVFVRVEDSGTTNSDGNCREPVWEDFDNDGYLDLFVTSASGQRYSRKLWTGGARKSAS